MPHSSLQADRANRPSASLWQPWTASLRILPEPLFALVQSLLQRNGAQTAAGARPGARRSSEIAAWEPPVPPNEDVDGTDDDLDSLASTALESDRGAEPLIALPPIPQSLLVDLDAKKRELRERARADVESIRRLVMDVAERSIDGIENWFGSTEKDEVDGHIVHLKRLVETLQSAHVVLLEKQRVLERDVVPGLERRKEGLEKAVAEMEKRLQRKEKAFRQLEKEHGELLREWEEVGSELVVKRQKKKLWDAAVNAVWIVCILWGIVGLAALSAMASGQGIFG